MARKGGWFSAVKKVLIPDPKKDQKNHKSNSRWFVKQVDLEPELTSKEAAPICIIPSSGSKEDKLENEKTNQYNSSSVAVGGTDIATEAAVIVVADATEAEVVSVTKVPHCPKHMSKEAAAIKIQTSFRGYLARGALRTLRALVRLKTLIQGQCFQRQAVTTLKCMQTLPHVQSHVSQRNTRMSDENQAFQRQLQRKHERELNKVEEEWDFSMKSKEQVKARLQGRKEAAMRRERALAYASSHQQTWKNPSKSVNSLSMIDIPYWSWSLMERCRPWDKQHQSTINSHINNSAYENSSTNCAMSIRDTKLCSQGDLILNHGGNTSKPSSAAGPKSSRPPPASKAAAIHLSSCRKGGPLSLKDSANEDNPRSMFKSGLGHNRRHSIGGSLSLLRGDGNLTNSVNKAKSTKIPSPNSSIVVAAKKQLSSHSSLGGSKRHSCPPKVEVFSENEGC